MVKNSPFLKQMYGVKAYHNEAMNFIF